MQRALKQHWAIVESRVEPMPGSMLLVLNSPSLAASAAPGQFVMLKAAEGRDPYLRLPVPIHRIYSNGIALLMNARDLTAQMSAVGSRLDMLGPAGRGIVLAAGQTAALVAQGAGIAPLMSLADKGAARITLWSWVASPAQVYPPQLVPRAVEYRPFVGEAAAGAFYESLADIPGWASAVFAAGDKAMYTELARLFGAQSLSLRQGKVQVWHMGDLACGMGACGGCLVPTRRGKTYCCQDGPFIDLADLVL